MEADETLAERMCIVTRDVLDESALIRFVRSPSAEAVPDLQRVLPGRGVWVGLSRARVAEAQKRNLFSRGFKAETSAAADLPERISALLRKQALSYLSLARKAGEAVSGFVKCEEWLKSGRARLLLQANDASEDGRRKLAQMAHRDVALIALFNGAELDLALGRSPVVHAAMANGGLAEKLLAAARTIEVYEAG